MHYLKRGLIRTFQQIKEHKKIFASLLVLQLLLLIVCFSTLVHYQIKIGENINGLIEPLQEANYNLTSLQQGQSFMQDSYNLYLSYKSMVQNILTLAGYLAVIFLVGQGILWLLSQRLLDKQCPLGQSALKFLAAFLLFVIPLLILGYLLFKLLVSYDSDPQNWGQKINYFFYLLLLCYYFFSVALALINLPSWNSWLKKIFFCSLRKVHWSLLVWVINWALLCFSLYLAYLVSNYFSSTSFWLFILLLLSIVLVIFVLVLARIFWIACLHELVEENKENTENKENKLRT